MDRFCGFCQTFSFAVDDIKIIRCVIFSYEMKSMQHSCLCISILFSVTAVDELTCRPITRYCMEAGLLKAVQRPFVPTVTMKLLWNDF